MQIITGDYTDSDISVTVQEELRADFTYYYEHNIRSNNADEPSHQNFLYNINGYARNNFGEDNFADLTYEQRQETINAVMAQQGE